MSSKTAIEFTQTCLELATELSRGPVFFDNLNHPTAAVERYTGTRLTRDTDRCLVAGALRLLECSDRQISEALKCDVRSIPLMLEEAEKTGRIPALKDRLAQWTGRNAERAQLALRELLNSAVDGSRSIELAAMIKAVATAGGIATQNLQLLTGGPTEILELRVGAGREEIERWAKEHAVPIEAEVVAPTKPPTDLQATGKGAERPQTEGAGAPGHGRDTSARDQDPVETKPEDPAAAVADPGRGGSVPVAGAERADGSNGS